MVNSGRHGSLIFVAFYFVCSVLLFLAYLFRLEGLVYVAQPFIFFMFFCFMYFSRGRNPIQLDLIFLAFLLMYSLATPISFYLNENSSVDAGVVFLSTVLCLAANVSFAFGIFVAECFGFGRAKFRIESQELSRQEILDARRVGYFMFWLGVALSFLAITLTVGFSAYLGAGYAGRALIKREAGPIELGLYVAVLGIVLALSATLAERNRSKLGMLFLVAVSLLFFVYVSFLGVRRPTFLLVISVVSVYCLLVNRIKLRSIILLGASFFIFFVTFANYRQVISSHGFFEAIEFIGENVSPEWFDFSKTELGAPFKTLQDILGGGFKDDLLWGGSYLGSLLYVLPGFVNGGMESLSVEYTNKFFTADFIAIGGNMGFFPVAEAFVNFGWFGPLVVFFVLAVVLVRMNSFLYMAPGKKLFHVVFFSILVPWLAFFMRLDFSSFLKGFFYSQLVPLVLVYFLLSLRGRRAA